ncbi:protein of unknown function [Methylorubrum extorquens]|uniref:Uncharacterized protein n=1 Tax=Methylorubrum extorquens TaxID=408 RepID=A0A2N9AYQ6_METEX|nr:protein of unknown function [Methylorubrum extorquens]
MGPDSGVVASEVAVTAGGEWRAAIAVDMAVTVAAWRAIAAGMAATATEVDTAVTAGGYGRYGYRGYGLAAAGVGAAAAYGAHRYYGGGCGAYSYYDANYGGCVPY